eukprot:2431233-Amphidinium_carterae.1
MPRAQYHCVFIDLSFRQHRFHYRVYPQLVLKAVVSVARGLRGRCRHPTATQRCAACVACTCCRTLGVVATWTTAVVACT